MLGPDAEVPLGEVDDPALGHGLKALLALAVVPQPDPGVLVHLHRQKSLQNKIQETILTNSKHGLRMKSVIMK